MIALAASKASASSGIAAAVVSECGEVATTRINRLGESRHGTVFWDLTCSSALTGDSHHDNGLRNHSRELGWEGPVMKLSSGT